MQKPESENSTLLVASSLAGRRDGRRSEKVGDFVLSDAGLAEDFVEGPFGQSALVESVSDVC